VQATSVLPLIKIVAVKSLESLSASSLVLVACLVLPVTGAPEVTNLNGPGIVVAVVDANDEALVVASVLATVFGRVQTRMDVRSAVNTSFLLFAGLVEDAKLHLTIHEYIMFL